MKRSGVLNPQLAAALARLGHTDQFVIADCGLPIPPHVEVIDLSVVLGLPPLLPVLRAVLDEVVIEGGLIAQEAKGTKIGDDMRDALGLEPDYVSHDELKRRVRDASFVVRTGENTPYANVVLTSGVPF